MPSNDPQPPDRQPDTSSEDDWDDAWAGGGPTDAGGGPTDAGGGPTDAGGGPTDGGGESTEEADPVSQMIDTFDDFQDTRGPTHQVKVREITPVKLERVRPEPSGIDTSQRGDLSLEGGVVDRQGIEEKEWSKPTAFNPKWVAAITLLVLALIVSCLILVQRGITSGKEGAKGAGKAQKPEFVVKLEEELKELHGRRDEACKIYADFASAQVVEEILPMVRNAAQLRNLIRQTGHKRLVDKEWQPQFRAMWTPYLLRGKPKPFACLSGELPDFSNFKAYFVMEGGYLLLDWKATTAYSTASFEELSQGQGDGSELRGYMKPAALYTAVWPEDQYHCYQFESPDKRDIIWCYVKRSSELAKALGMIFLKGEIVEQSDKVQPMTLKLARGSEGGLPNQWLIEDVIHEEWIEIN